MIIDKLQAKTNPIIRKIRRKFILANALGATLIMLILSSTIFMVFFVQTWSRINDTLTFIVNNGGILEEEDKPEHTEDSPEFSPEFRFATRFFTVFLDENNEVESVYLQHIAAISEEEAQQYAQDALNHRTFRADVLQLKRLGRYYYKIGESDSGSFIVFLDCEEQINSYQTMLKNTALTVGTATLLVFLFTFLVSMRAIRPEIENIQKQREFITNAGHELKTPLAVIRANTELNEMLYGSNEWSQSTLRQVDRMSELIKVFVTLAKSEERYGEGSFSAVNLSTLAEDTCNTFASVAEQAGKTLTGDITPDITVNGDSGTLQALITILVDNAVKYCDEGGDIRVVVLLRGKNAVLQVSNRYAEGKDIDYSRFFERFYRADTSHNIEKGGYGIGLSIAQNIAEHHKGKLTVSWKDGDITFEFVLKALLFLP